MVDLKNQQENVSDKARVPSKKLAHNAAKEKKAKIFLCIMLSFTIIFTSVVCVFVGLRNKHIRDIAIISSAEAENRDGTKKHEVAGNHTNNDTTGKTTPSQTSAPAETGGVTVAPGGTINNPKIIEIDSKNWHLTLVNSGYRIPDNYNPDLVTVCGSGERLDRKVAEHYEAMYNAALKDNVYLTPCSGYRSYETQERNYNRKTEYFMSQGLSEADAKIEAATIIMPPGSSEHNLGYAMDIVCVEEWFETTNEFKWLQENAADYGFIMRYPKEKQDITKVIYEPWHWRYVGVEDAKKIKESGLVLEEYLGG